MSIDFQKLRLFGVYRQDQDDHLMLRVKIPAGFMTSTQTDEICALSEEFSNGVLHLTCRGSIEFHWLRHEQLTEIFARLEAVGLTTRGACGGTVRGISCSTTFAPKYALVQPVAAQLNRHFAGNPEFEGLPKKFKVGIEAGYRNGHHLIQDVGLVLCEPITTGSTFDVWCAGGLGREPQAAFLLETRVAQERLIPLIEAIVQVYRQHTPRPKRLKYLLATIGEAEFRHLLKVEMDQRPQPDVNTASLLSAPAGVFHEVLVFAGEIATPRLRRLAATARDYGSGYLAVTADQNLALLTERDEQHSAMRTILEGDCKLAADGAVLPRLRVCPGGHECRMGLVLTRDVARRLETVAGQADKTLSFAVSGCGNSCSQPQLADIGILTKKLATTPEDGRLPLFDLYRREEEGLGCCVAEDLNEEELFSVITEMIRSGGKG